MATKCIGRTLITLAFHFLSHFITVWIDRELLVAHGSLAFDALALLANHCLDAYVDVVWRVAVECVKVGSLE